MRKSFAALFLGGALLAGCGSESPVPAADARAATAAPSSKGTGRLGAALLTAPAGMQVSYGPEIGPYGSLKATRLGQEAVRQAKLDRPECASTGQLDANAPAVKGSQAAVIAFASQTSSLTQSLVELPANKAVLPGPLAKQCRRYRADVGGQAVTYATQELRVPKVGDGTRAFLTTASGNGPSVQIGSGVVRHGNVIMSILMVGSKVKYDDLNRNIRQAYQKLATTLP
ncbi:hypothetical protein ACIBH1_43580 [Nonomuraea sp. NPDC050663]|uniref:hypothetical protein n=1 Tax=Nonomuraea sp. NPDC050663 TaxID=3364370 RepID=UPI003789DD74